MVGVKISLAIAGISVAGAAMSLLMQGYHDYAQLMVASYAILAFVILITNWVDGRDDKTDTQWQMNGSYAGTDVVYQGTFAKSVIPKKTGEVVDLTGPEITVKQSQNKLTSYPGVNIKPEPNEAGKASVKKIGKEWDALFEDFF